MQLNTEQEQAAEAMDGAFLITACPGAGKTRVIIERVARMIAKGVNPKSIVCITFTNRAAGELLERLSKRVGESISKGMSISTFHRLCLKILRRYGQHLGYSSNMTIIDPDEQIDLILQIARQQDIEITRPEAKIIAWHVNDNRENSENDDDLYERFEKSGEESHYQIATDYQKQLLKNDQIDFTGMLSETVRLLRDFPDVLSKIQYYIKYLLCDESQDTNKIQYDLLNTLMSHNGNIFTVADLDQSIYSFRGARYENIADFIKKWNPKRIVLNTNYRSTPQILKHAKLLIDHNPNREIIDLKTPNADGPPVICKAFDTDLQEADTVAKTIKQILDSGKYKAKNIAVLYRMNSMSRAIEMACIANEVPYQVKGNLSFFDRKEIKDSIAMLRFLVNPKDGISFHRIANKPKRSLGDTTVGKIELYAKNNNCDLMQSMKEMTFGSKAVMSGIGEIISAYNFDYQNMTVAQSLYKLMQNLRYEEYLKEDDEESYTDRWENIQELIRDAARYSQENGPEISKYLDQIALTSSNDDEEEEDKISLQSAHSSKGLEFDCVFLIGINEDILPHKKAVQEREDGINEENRLFYVMLTRCRQFLHVSFCKRRQDGFAATKGKVSYKYAKPSQFLYKAGLLKEPPKTAPQTSDFTSDSRISYSASNQE